MVKPRRLTFTEGEDPSPLATIGDVVIATGVKRATAVQWVQRGIAPPPVAYVAAGAIWWWQDWLDWLKVARPRIYERMMSREQTNGETLDLEGRDERTQERGGITRRRTRYAPLAGSSDT